MWPIGHAVFGLLLFAERLEQNNFISTRFLRPTESLGVTSFEISAKLSNPGLNEQ